MQDDGFCLKLEILPVQLEMCVTSTAEDDYLQPPPKFQKDQKNYLYLLRSAQTKVVESKRVCKVIAADAGMRSNQSSCPCLHVPLAPSTLPTN